MGVWNYTTPNEVDNNLEGGLVINAMGQLIQVLKRKERKKKWYVIQMKHQCGNIKGQILYFERFDFSLI